jgi:hypothetical protein
MTLPEIYERIGSLPTGGYLTSDSRLDTGYIYSLVHSARAFVCCERFKMYGKVPPIYYQNHRPDYRKAAQDNDCCVTFYDFPVPIAMDGRMTGMGFNGNINGTPISFREISSLQAFSAMQTDRIMKAGRKAYVLFGPDYIQVWSGSQKIKEIDFQAVWSDPTKISSYNIDFDNYPIDISDIAKVEQYLMQGTMGMIYKTPIDRINDGRDITVPPAPATK